MREKKTFEAWLNINGKTIVSTHLFGTPKIHLLRMFLILTLSAFVNPSFSQHIWQQQQVLFTFH